ncbi:alpha/beta hydrolase [Sphaerisporangium album]|uniref:Alpha/beta hydrolase n=1 Tax=Sphaerisporangium album TaxID=509200 RepID=A0A367F697_9ACTN|nr:alpha/beta hydrolase [Sphaerisporangium album]RCG25070.1 alpha/beta hydrolase [Sphaerisporangium album]
MAMIRRRWSRIALRSALALALVAVAGFGYETIARSGDGERRPPPGRLIAVEGHRMQLDCSGRGGPTVVLEAGLGESSASWAGIQAQLAQHGRVCSYDRAGYAWSEDGPGPRTAGRAARELHALLAAAGEAGPYVLVGHSYGGAVVRLFAAERPGETAGLVLVDVMDETGTAELGAAKPFIAAQFTLYQAAARLGLVRLLGGDAVTPSGAPEPARRAAPIVYGAGTMATARAEGLASLDSAAEVRATVRPGMWRDMPVVVIAAAGQPDRVLGHYRDMAALSTRGRLVVAKSPEHYVQYAEPRLVLDSIQEVVTEARPSK